MAGFQESTGQLTTQEKAALHEFSYSDGYRFLGTDLGGLGVKLELVDKQQDAAAIILPPAKAKECTAGCCGRLASRNRGCQKSCRIFLKG